MIVNGVIEKAQRVQPGVRAQPVVHEGGGQSLCQPDECWVRGQKTAAGQKRTVQD